MITKDILFEDSQEFIDDLFEFLYDKSYEFKRQSKIDQIFNNLDGLADKLSYLEKNSPINTQSVYGSTFQSKYRNNEQIYAITHNINCVYIKDGKISASVEPNTYGKIIDFEKCVLKPVYYKKNQEKYCIATFDIDFNTIV